MARSTARRRGGRPRPPPFGKENGPAQYARLCERFESGDTTLAPDQCGTVYYGFAAQSRYNGSLGYGEVDAMTLIEQDKPQEAFALCERILNKAPVSLQGHMLLLLARRPGGNTPGAGLPVCDPVRRAVGRRFQKRRRTQRLDGVPCAKRSGRIRRHAGAGRRERAFAKPRRRALRPDRNFGRNGLQGRRNLFRRKSADETSLQSFRKK